MPEPLLPGAVLGALVAELLKIVSEAIRRCVNFKQTLTYLSTALKLLSPVIQDIEELNNELGRPKKELESLLSTMREGKQLVFQVQCSNITPYNLVARIRYERKLQTLIKSLEWNLNIYLPAQMARDLKETLCRIGRQQEELERSTFGHKNRFTNPSAPNDSKSTNGIDLVNFRLVDSGATSHIACSLNLFDSYTLLSNRFVLLPNHTQHK